MQQQRFTSVVLGKCNCVQFCAYVIVYLAELESVQNMHPQMLCNPTQSHTALSHKQLLELLCGIELALQTAEKNLHKIK